MKTSKNILHFVNAASLVLLLLAAWSPRALAQDAASSGYDQQVRAASRLLKEGRLDEAWQAAQQAIKANPNDYLGYAIAAKIASTQGNSSQAKTLVDKALALAPDDVKDKVRQLKSSFEAAPPTEQPPASQSSSLSDQDRLKLNVLMLLLDEAAKAATPEERQKVFGDFLSRSADFVKAHPEQTNIWLMRAFAAIDLNRAHEAWEAGRHLKELGMLGSDDPKAGKILAELDLKGWLNQEPKFPDGEQRWTNSLGQVFVPVPGTSVMFCIWDVRVKDYRAYANGNGGVDGSWQNPQHEGVAVTPSEDCPVVNVSWNDAKAFCAWLTQQERTAGQISDSQGYRLPQETEWNQAVGNTKYPWGDVWPPPAGAGNYADSTAKSSFPSWPVIAGYDDGYATTSPVGSFAANRYGLFDMGGNVWQWCEDWYDSNQTARVLRGASWGNDDPSCALSAYRRRSIPGGRNGHDGFRCVLVAGGVVR